MGSTQRRGGLSTPARRVVSNHVPHTVRGRGGGWVGARFPASPVRRYPGDSAPGMDSAAPPESGAADA